MTDPTQPPPLPPPAGRRAWLLIVGMVAGNLVAGILFAGLVRFIGAYKESQISVFAAPNFFLLPLIAGLIASWFWRSLNHSVAATALDALWSSLLSILAAVILFREGAICLLMAFPALYIMTFAGMLLGRFWFRYDRKKLRVLILPLLVLVTAGDAIHKTGSATIVTDTLVINAPPAKVWPHVLAFPPIPDRPTYWIFRIGLPYPMETTNGGNFVGADRQCIFSDGIVIRERVAELIPRQKLTFDIVEQPTHPEVYGHITLHSGQFLLRDNHDGTTTLIGSSWYTLHVRPAWYFDLWARDMAHAVHRRVMQHVRRLAESRDM